MNISKSPSLKVPCIQRSRYQWSMRISEHVPHMFRTFVFGTCSGPTKAICLLLESRTPGSAQSNITWGASSTVISLESPRWYLISNSNSVHLLTEYESAHRPNRESDFSEFVIWRHSMYKKPELVWNSLKSDFNEFGTSCFEMFWISQCWSQRHLVLVSWFW